VFPDAPIGGLVVQGCLLIYPMLYNGRQAYKAGLRYFLQPLYYVDMANIALGFGSIYC